MKRVWRYLDSGILSAGMNMAIDEAIASSVQNGSAPPTLRFFGWERPSVTLGYFQKHTDIDISCCREKDIPVVRRPTGGRAILHGDELTYSFCARNADHEAFRSLMSSYEILSHAFMAALASLGCPVEMRRRREKGGVLSRNPDSFETVSFGEIAACGRKIVGSAQKRFPGGFLQQGSIPLRPDPALSERVFGGTRPVVPALGTLLPDLDVAALKAHIRKSCEEILGTAIVPGKLNRGERVSARVLLTRKYRAREWTEFR